MNRPTPTTPTPLQRHRRPRRRRRRRPHRRRRRRRRRPPRLRPTVRADAGRSRRTDSVARPVSTFRAGTALEGRWCSLCTAMETPPTISVRRAACVHLRPPGARWSSHPTVASVSSRPSVNRSRAHGMPTTPTRAAMRISPSPTRSSPRRTPAVRRGRCMSGGTRRAAISGSPWRCDGPSAWPARSSAPRRIPPPVSNGSPRGRIPFYFLIGDADFGIDNARQTAAALESAGHPVHLEVLPGVGHGGYQDGREAEIWAFVTQGG
jgi:hypothetical protein